MKNYYVYIKTNVTNRVLYVGFTNSVYQRSVEHKLKLVDGFTKKYNVTKLIYFQEFTNLKDAIAGEKKLKGLNRGKKSKLIESTNPEWDDLFPILEKNIYTNGLSLQRRSFASAQNDTIKPK